MKALLYPLLVQVTLTFVVMFHMYARRAAEFSAERIKPQEVATRAQAAQRLRSSAAASDNFSNQFELPVLFYAAVAIAVSLLMTDLLLVTLAWAFVGLRVIHAFIHLTYNDVLHRFFPRFRGTDEPQDGLGKGDRAPDWTEPVIDPETGIITLQLRAERAGKGDGRVYTVIITAEDTSGNSSIETLEIQVPHDNRKK